MPLRSRREIGGPSDGAHQHADVSPICSGPVVTTIRVTRRPRTPSVVVEDTATRSAPEPASGAEGASSRLALIDPPSARTTLDGAWWPRTRDLAQELPALVEELHRRGIRVTRVAYNPDLWGPAPRRLDADGRTIRLGWFRNLDRQLLNMTGDVSRGRLDFLVIPPDTTAAAAEHAFSAATDRANRQAPTELLDMLSAAGPPVPAPRSAHEPDDTEETAAWDSEGGHQYR
jgi:uncharacterized protein DUF5994